MKILYAVQATGNGHISRAHQLYPYLTQFGEVDIMLSGSNSTLASDIPVKYRSRGISLYYSECGGLDYLRMARNFSLPQIRKDVRQLPVDKYDLVINDFDYITARACSLRKKKSVQFGHQASFTSANVPRPSRRSIVGEYVLKNYAVATHYVGLHFKSYDKHIFPPVIKKEIMEARPQDHGHITVYLPAYDQVCIENLFLDMHPVEFHWFLPGITKPFRKQNIHYFPVNQQDFNHSLVHCHGLLTGGGFETPAEALYLGKKLLSVPIRDQYEQQCNSAALKEMGIPVIQELNGRSHGVLDTWISGSTPDVHIEANDIHKTLQHIVDQVVS